MSSELLGYMIVQNDEDNTVTVYKNDKPLLRADLIQADFQAFYHETLLQEEVNTDLLYNKEITVFLEDVNWLNGPMTHFEYVGAL